MKKLLIALASIALSLQAASAAPYVVYSGQAQATVTSATGPVTSTTDVYLVTDLADTSSYGILQYDAKTKQGAITIYPIANPTAVEANLNFFGDVATTSGKNSLAVLSIGDILTDSSSNSNITHAYTTGSLTTAKTTLSNARAKLTFATRANGAVTGTVTFPVAAAITNNALPYPPALNGTTLSYTIAPTGALTQATGNGNFGISLDYNFTPAANIGAEYSSGGNVTAINPINTTNSTVLVAYSNFLGNLATALGVTLPLPQNIGGGDGGATITTGGTGTDTIGGNGGTGTFTIGNTGGNGGNGGNGGTGTLTGTGTTTGDGGSGDTGSITIGTGTTTGTGSITIGSGLGNGPSLSGSLSLSLGTIQITSVSGSLFSGTVVTAASPSVTVSFSNVALVIGSTPVASGIATGTIFHSTSTLTGGTYTPAGPISPLTYSNGTLTIAGPAPTAGSGGGD